MGLTCSECGMEVMEGDAFCGECGAQVVEASVEQAPEPIAPPPPVTPEVPAQPVQQSCPNCRRIIERGEHFCPWCGVQVGGAAPPPPVPPQAPVGVAPGGQAPPAAPGGFAQQSNEISDRVKGTWENPATRLPVMFLVAMVVGFALIADVANTGLVYPLLLGGLIFFLLILHATSPTSGDGPILGAAGIAFVLSVLGSIVGTGVIVGLIESEGASFEFSETRDESITVTLGAGLALVGSVGLFLTTLRAYVLELLGRS